MSKKTQPQPEEPTVEMNPKEPKKATQMIVVGNNTEVLKQYPDNHFDSIVTDAPYGLGKEPNANELLQAWVTHGYLEIKGKGFMGKEWDAFVPQPIFWKEVFRVLKHGGHVVCFFGTRTYDYGCMAIRLAGFEIRDQISYIYGSGFPKSMDISKQINKMNGVEFEEKPASGVGFMNKEGKGGYNITKNQLIQKGESSEEAKQWDGWGTALKPAQECIVLARKPMEKGLNVTQNILKWGTGGLNIDLSRIASSEEIMNHSRSSESAVSKGKYGDSKEQETHQTNGQKLGRFPANIILSHHPECECLGYKKVKGSNCTPDSIGKGRDGDHTNGIYGAKASKVSTSHTDADGMEIVEEWNCHNDCPVKILDDQSGVKTSGKVTSDKDAYEGESNTGFLRGKTNQDNQYGDTGSASRFFYIAKASKSEKNFGLDNFEEKEGGGMSVTKDKTLLTGSGNERNNLMKNFHPTVKPIKLMQYLVRLVTPEGGIVCDPFVGSGTTGCACKIDGFNFVGIDITPEYAPIAQARIDAYVEEREFIDECKIFDSMKDVIPNQLNLFE
jgi:DNA modification methylase